MRLEKLLVPGLLLAGGYAIYQASKKLSDNFKVSIKKVEFNSKETLRGLWQKLYFNLLLDVLNPSLLSGKVTGISLSVYYNGKAIGSVIKNDPLTIAANATATVNLLVGVPTFDIFKSIKEAVTAFTKGQSVNIQVKGLITTNLGNIKIDETRRVV